MIINERVGSPIRSDNVYFANNEQTFLVFFAHAEHNLVKLKLYNNYSILSEASTFLWKIKKLNRAK